MMENEARSGNSDVINPPWVHLLSAFLAMEPSDSLLSISKECGGGAITENVQNFIWDKCISKSVSSFSALYRLQFYHL
ncbi:hypothetical protein Tco_1014877 [Tanacetum coccineum]